MGFREIFLKFTITLFPVDPARSFQKKKGEGKIILWSLSGPPGQLLIQKEFSRIVKKGIHLPIWKKRFFGGGLALILFLFSAGTLWADLVKIGLLIPTQESGTGVDHPYLRGAEIAAAEVNANEGKQGTQLLLFVRRGSYLQRRDLNALRELFFEERVHFLMGAVQREAILTVSRLAQEQRIPFLVFPVDFMEAASTGEEPPNLFWISPSPEAFQRAAVRTMVQIPKNRFYLLARNSTNGLGWVKYFWEEMSKQRPDAQRLGETFLPARVDDYNPYIQTVLSADAEVCVSHFGVKEWLGFYQTANKQGYFKKVTHCELECGNLESLVAMKKKVPEGIWGISAFPFWGLGRKETKEFVDKYKKNNNSYPSLAALSGYVSIYALFEAVQKAASLESEKVVGTLEDLTFRTPVGQMSIRKTDHRTMWPIWVGSTQNVPDYPFPVLGNLKALGPDAFSP